MDLKKIFIKDANPTKVGGQAVLEGIMMKGAERTSIALRLPDGGIHIKTEKNPRPGKLTRVPLIRGAIVFFASLVQGIRTLMYSADVLAQYEDDEEEQQPEEQGRFTSWLEEKYGEKAVWNFMLYSSLFLAIVFSVGIFMIGPTILTSAMKHITTNEILLNLFEGVLRIALFILYIVIVSKMPDIRRTFEYHGAEHKCIHCYENGLELTPANCQTFYTLHPRCGTSFLMFVLVIALILFSLLGWPNLLWRILSRVLLIPVIAGLSYELLKWAGSTDNWFVKILSIPGLALQKITTAQPDDSELEVAIAAMKAVLAEEGDYGEGRCDAEGHIIERKEPLETGGVTAD
ncbi:MAG: DUF1385 domain-containing protein [Anaerovoracaceae bacterium]|jgi:uncharacterized protein YqhQ